MDRRMTWMAVLTFCFALGIAPFDGSSARADDEKTLEAKALEANPELRKTLAKSDVYKQLKASLPKVKVGKTECYIAEGDLRLDDDQLLFYARDRARQNEKWEQAKQGGPSPDGSPVGHLLADADEQGKILRWSPGSTLTYCVLKSTFTDDEYNTVVANLKAAGDAWAQTCNIKFEHKPSLDNSPDSDDGPPDGVLFSVKKTTPSDGVIASSFFPRSPASQRVLLVFPFYFQDDMPYDRVGTFRHEFGHILCFRHEHIRSEAPPVCATGEPLQGAIPLTAYDPQSVMHYFCEAAHVGTVQQAISNDDKVGALQIYPFPNPAGLATPNQSSVKDVKP
jgi:hypothetical protein